MKKLLVCVLLTSILLFFLYAVGIVVIPGKNYDLGKNIESKITSSLSIGSSRKEVENFLDSEESIKYQYIGNREDLEFTSDVRRSKFKIDDLSGVIQASIPEIGYSLMTERGIEIVFFFDKEEHLVGYEVKGGGIVL